MAWYKKINFFCVIIYIFIIIVYYYFVCVSFNVKFHIYIFKLQHSKRFCITTSTYRQELVTECLLRRFSNKRSKCMCYVIRIYRNLNRSYVTVVLKRRAQTQLSRGACANPTAAFHDPGAEDPTSDKLQLILYLITISNGTELLHNTHLTCVSF